MNSIFITGGAGFIGSHTCLIFLEKGFNIFVIDSLVNSSSKSIENVLSIIKKKKVNTKGEIHLIKGDIKNKTDI